MHRRARKKLKFAKSTYKKKVKKPVKQKESREDAIFKKVVESKKAVESGLEQKAESIKEQIEVAEPKPVEERETVKLLVETIPEQETFFGKVQKKLKAIFSRKKFGGGTNA